MSSRVGFRFLNNSRFAFRNGSTPFRRQGFKGRTHLVSPAMAAAAAIAGHFVDIREWK